MFKHFGFPVFLFATVVAFLYFFSPADLHAQVPQFSVTLLGPLSGSSGAVAYSINASGEIVGSATTGNFTYDAVTWSGTTPTVLGPISGAADFVGTAVNGSGVVVGNGYPVSNNASYGIEWTGTNPTLLGSLGGTLTKALAINASGEIAGYSLTSQSVFDAVEWTGTTPTVLGSLNSPFGGSEAFGLNDSGKAVGFSTPSSGLEVPVKWTGTTPTILQSENGRTGAPNIALAINDSGVIVGTSQGMAIEWTGTTATVLITSVGNISEATAINSFGQVVGYSGTSGFIYISGTTYNINSLLAPGSNFNVEQLYGINDSGQLVGVGTLGGQQYAVQLNPVSVPEPSDIWLSSGAFAVGVGLVVWRRRRRSDNCRH